MQKRERKLPGNGLFLVHFKMYPLSISNPVPKVTVNYAESCCTAFLLILQHGRNSFQRSTNVKPN